MLKNCILYITFSGFSANTRIASLGDGAAFSKIAHWHLCSWKTVARQESKWDDLKMSKRQQKWEMNILLLNAFKKILLSLNDLKVIKALNGNECYWRVASLESMLVCKWGLGKRSWSRELILWVLGAEWWLPGKINFKCVKTGVW